MFLEIISVLALAIFVRIVVKWTYKMCDSKVCLMGKTALITGGNKGIGFQTSLALASKGCKVIILCRSNADETVKKLKELTQNSEIYCKQMDLASLKSIRACSKEIHNELDSIDILINNAGIAATDCYYTKEGLPNVMCSNLLGHFLLTHLLMDLLRRSENARVLFLTSITIYISPLKVEDLDKKSDDPNKFLQALETYANSKLGQAVVAVEMAERLKNTNVKVNALNPGNVSTELFDQTGYCDLNFVQISVDWIFKNMIVKFYLRTPEEGAQRSIMYAISNECRETTGHVDTGFNWLIGLPKCLGNKEYRKSIWEAIEKLTDLNESEKIKQN